MKTTLIALLAVLALSGCATWEQEGSATKRVLDGIESKEVVVEQLAKDYGDKVTGGWASIVVGGIFGALGVARGVNRSILARKRAQAIAEIHMNPEYKQTAHDQVTTAQSLKVVEDILKRT